MSVGHWLLVIFGSHLFGPLGEISFADKVRAFDKEVDNRGIKIISLVQADDVTARIYEIRDQILERRQTFLSPAGSLDLCLVRNKQRRP